MSEPKMSLDEAKEAAAAGKYPKVTEESIKAKIKKASYLSHTAETGGVLTICIIEMENGFMVQGVSAAADPRNHKQEIGESFAFNNALKQLWVLEGYLLRDSIYHAESF